jgi:hypothetical protein
MAHQVAVDVPDFDSSVQRLFNAFVLNVHNLSMSSVAIKSNHVFEWRRCAIAAM